MTVPNAAADEDILETIDRLARENGEPPGRNEVMRRAGIGAGRASRLLKQWQEHQERQPRPLSVVPPPRPTRPAGKPAPRRAEQAPHPEPSAAAELEERGQTSAAVRPPEPSAAEQTSPIPAVLDRADVADHHPTSERTEHGQTGLDQGEQPDQSGRAPVEVADRPAVEAAPVAGADDDPRRAKWVFIVGAIVGLVVSVDTSWRFFRDRLGIEEVWERVAMFAGLEIVLIACGVAMYESVKRFGKPGNARWLAWALCAASGYVAVLLDGPGLGLARVVFGPVLSVVAFHFALGIEVRARRGRRTGLLGAAVEELQQRLASRLGLGDDERSAVVRTRQRAVRKAARLATARVALFRQARLRRALRLANVAHDEQQQAALMREYAVLRSVDTLRRLDVASPWPSAEVAH
ncbi:hypothetical protein BAY59_38465 (plasmid) [Prauserella coralliicola]|nr:hypothetical protein BAY59_38465 [Prauserella coralliicola]